jgi:glycosyltransferase involved in cell wall biosynthesis
VTEPESDFVDGVEKTIAWPRRPVKTPGVVVSSGFGRFPLAMMAVEAHRRGLLKAFITGAYPRRRPRRGFDTSFGKKVGRKYRGFLDRGLPLPPELIYALWSPEAVHEVARLYGQRQSTHTLPHFLTAASHELYGRSAGRVLARIGADYGIYHFRSGFGGHSLCVAKELGATTLCDHTIVHPSVLEHLVEHNGAFPEARISTIKSPMWRGVLRDIESADHVVVNSDFVRKTFLHQGFPNQRLHVIYWGLDDAFLETARSYPEREPHSGPLTLLFAGSVERRKGAHILLEALQRVNDVDWKLVIVGRLESFISKRYGSLLNDPRITLHDTVRRIDLATHMYAAEVFIFPSLAEGSARVVMEAMALGCVIITTPNTGSVVEEPSNGIIVDPGDVDALSTAVRRVAELRPQLPTLGSRNRRLVLKRYRQRDSGDAYECLYQHLTGEGQQ